MALCAGCGVSVLSSILFLDGFLGDGPSGPEGVVQEWYSASLVGLAASSLGIEAAVASKKPFGSTTLSVLAPF